MDNAAILECLEEKRALFAEYEECTAKMCDCEIDSLQDYITKRAQLANKIDSLNQEIEQFCDMADDPDLMRDVIMTRSNYGDLSENLRMVYDKAAQVFTLINRVYNMDPQIRDRMSSEREALLKKIKSGSGTAKVYHYVKNLAEQPQSGLTFSSQSV